jgi:serine protease inhibitor
MRLLTLIFLLLLVPVISCDKKEEVKLGPKEIKLTSEQKDIVSGSNRFGLDLFREILAGEEDGENVFISPLSIHLALTMAWNGARGNTGDQMMETMNFPDIGREAVNASVKKLITDLLSADPRVETGIANSIWYRDTYSVEQDFLEVNRKFFDARISPLDFEDPSSRDVINAWVAEKTRDRIKQIVDRIDPDHIMFLINAIYFKGIWRTEFVPEQTRERPFRLSDGNVKQVMTMETEGQFAYAQRNGYRAIELPYGRGNYSMLVFLPDEEVGIAGIMEMLTPEEWGGLSDVLQKMTVNVRLPKVTVEYETVLNSALNDIGMTDAFDRYKADFTGINQDGGLYIARVRHKSFLEINEEGTEAAAVTSVEIRIVSFDPEAPQVINFHADRPFVLAIREKYTNSIIFLGRIMEP